jgi:hypothetical protein
MKEDGLQLCAPSLASNLVSTGLRGLEREQNHRSNFLGTT